MKKDSHYGNSRVANGSKNVAVARGVGSRGRTPNVQGQGMKGMRGIAVTSRPTINIRDCGFGSGTVWAEREMRKLGEAGDAGNAKTVEFQETCFVKVTHTAMNEVASRRGYNSEKG